MAAAAANIDKTGSPHPIMCIKIGKYSVSGHSVLRSENFCFQRQADREVSRLKVLRPDHPAGIFKRMMVLHALCL
jgi:hypothetical protein